MKNKKSSRGRVDMEALLRPVTVSLFIILLSFFILLNSLGERVQEKENAVFKSLSKSFGGSDLALDEGEGGFPVPLVDPRSIIDLLDIEQSFALSKAQVNFVYDRNKATIVMGEEALFQGTAPTLAPGSEQYLDLIATEIKKSSYPVDIGGFTDNIPPAPESEFSNRNLSALRAVNVLKYFTEVSKIDAGRFTPFGWGEQKPMMPNTTAASRKLNRRVEISFVHRGVREKRGVFIFKDFFFRVFE